MKKFKNYLKELNQLAKNRPESLEMDVITAKDDEGNGFNYVHYSPSIGFYDDENFHTEDDDLTNSNNVVLLN